MRIIKLFLILSLSSGVLFTSCNTGNEGTGQAQQPLEQEIPEPGSENEEGEDKDVFDEKQLYDLVQQWNAALNNKDYSRLMTLYGTDVNLYNEVLSTQEVVQNKKTYLAQHPGFSQEISGIEVLQHTGNVAQVNFNKKVKQDNTIREFDAFLMFEQNKGQWKIVAEGDKGEVKKEDKSQPRTMAESEITSCDKAAEAIFLSSPEVKKMLAEQYTRYEMEYTPLSPKNPNKNYWFWIYARVPSSGNFETYARYQVDPTSGQLYEYDLIDGSLNRATYDLKLAKFIKQYCGVKG